MLKECYKRLGISENSTPDEVKKAFRRKIKKLHPDLAKRTRENSLELSQLISAYETILNVHKKRKYYAHSQFAIEMNKTRFNYRTFLAYRLHEPRCWGKLILYEFLHKRNTQALELFERYKEVHSLKNALSRDEFLDCMVFLGEEYHRLGHYMDAFSCFEKIVQEEKKEPYFRDFMVDIYQYISLIFYKKLAKTLAKRELELYTERVSDLGVAMPQTKQKDS